MTSAPTRMSAAIARALGGVAAGSGWLVRCPVPDHRKGCGDRWPARHFSMPST